jgi:hypothetical protein
MMKIEDQVCSIELSKKLKKIGIPQESLLYHYDEPYEDGTSDWVITDWSDYETTYDTKGETYSAFSVAELGQLIPRSFHSGNSEGNDWICHFYQLNPSKVHASWANSEANARAKMIIYLVENNLMETR